ncbi:hypothetical protein LTR49_024782 [Elasticomyces elasticus]|nr:hypothetical protein LTR49_024782 [Elasticomyces elasticus]
MCDDEKLEYIRAVKCIHELPPQGTSYFGAVVTRFEDFASAHINASTAPAGNPATIFVGPGIHLTGNFLPWHRVILWEFETALINECNYKGAQPYWDWSLDTVENNGAFYDHSPVFDPVTGFGGNSYTGSMPDNTVGPAPPNSTFPEFAGNCIKDGPFKDYNHSVGPNFNLQTPTPRCIIRNFNSTLANGNLQWKEHVLPVLEEVGHYNFSKKMSFPEPGPPRGLHVGGHASVGGEMREPWSTVVDPLFYLHHSNLDRIWAIWQDLKPQNFWAMDGPRQPDGLGALTTGPTSLGDILDLPPFISPSTSIRSVMDTKNQDGHGILCYVYEKGAYA